MSPVKIEGMWRPQHPTKESFASRMIRLIDYGERINYGKVPSKEARLVFHLMRVAEKNLPE